MYAEMKGGNPWKALVDPPPLPKKAQELGQKMDDEEHGIAPSKRRQQRHVDDFLDGEARFSASTKLSCRFLASRRRPPETAT
jgi:hypothetical protein